LETAFTTLDGLLFYFKSFVSLGVTAEVDPFEDLSDFIKSK
jgi:hypothetical protein